MNGRRIKKEKQIKTVEKGDESGEEKDDEAQELNYAMNDQQEPIIEILS